MPRFPMAHLQQLVALEAMRAELDAQTTLLGRADQGGLSLVPKPHTGAPLSPALDQEFLRLADSATSPRLVSLNGQLQSQEAVLTAELRVVEGQLHEERERRRDEVGGLLRVLEEEGARWKNAAAEGWATANRESRRKHASQLARMSAALSSNVLSGPSVGAYEDAHPIAGDDQGIDGTNRLFKSMSLHQLHSPSRLSYAMGTASTPQLDFGNNETNSVLEPVSHDEMCTPIRWSKSPRHPCHQTIRGSVSMSTMPQRPLSVQNSPLPHVRMSRREWGRRPSGNCVPTRSTPQSLSKQTAS